jgi:hypothetical protein
MFYLPQVGHVFDVSVLYSRVLNKRAAQHSVQTTGGILRGHQAFLWLWIYTVLKLNPRPPTCQ